MEMLCLVVPSMLYLGQLTVIYNPRKFGTFLGALPPVPASTVTFGGPAPSVPNTSHLTANTTIFSPSSFFIVVQTGLGLQLQVQLVPIMQVFVRLDPSYRGQMCGEAPVGLGVGLWGVAIGICACPSSRL